MPDHSNLIVIKGDNLELLKKYPDNYFDSVVTDPPYGLGKSPDAVEVMKGWIEKGYYQIEGKGFQGNEWDAFVPQPLFWKEVFRVLKHGGHVLSFYSTRTYDWGVMAMRFAGFEIRDCIQWVYANGFPKSHNVGIAVDKIQGNTREVLGISSSQRLNHSNRIHNSLHSLNGELLVTKGNSEWEGWGSALKPANEPIVVARKPLEKGLSIAENVLKWGTGGINIDGCRITFTDAGWGKRHNQDFTEWRDGRSFTYKAKVLEQNNLGRFPANIILTHHPECECKGLKKIKGMIDKLTIQQKNSGGFADENGQETVEDWNCHPDCPIKIMDEQSGAAASRFFYCAKASKSDRNKGLEGFEENFHPTVKPIKLMQYLVRLITPPNGKVLDPFCGSGTTGLACKLEGFEFVGMEQDPEYFKIAEARIKNYKEEKQALSKSDNKEQNDKPSNQMELF